MTTLSRTQIRKGVEGIDTAVKPAQVIWPRSLPRTLPSCHGWYTTGGCVGTGGSVSTGGCIAMGGHGLTAAS
jgi:hypothetical protein